MSEILVIGASGETATYNAKKLRQSLGRPGAGNDVIEQVIRDVQNSLFEGITTNKIHLVACSMLKKLSKKAASKYRLKKAIVEPDPTCFAFEKYVGALLIHEVYKMAVGQTAKGQCVNHEIDVIAEKDNHHFIVECKFHNQHGINCDLKIPLYIQARLRT